MSRVEAILLASIARAIIQSMGMVAENNDRSHRGQAMAYVEGDFQKVIADNGLEWNQVVQWLNENRATGND